MVYSFQNDYSEGACKEVLEALVKTNYEQNVGYGLDKHCLNATKLIKKAIKHDDVDIHYVTGGTPCNVLAISLLRAHEAVICCTNGHINTHETGAVEATGHKIIQTKAHDGKVCPKDIEEVVKNHPDEHMVKPKMVFISNPSEYGTIYSKKELKEISKVCKKNGLYLYLDGARLGACLTSKENDLTLKDICDLTDMFYIGGTKNGALLGEAMVIKNNDLKQDFRYFLKQKCSMLAKSKVIGTEFEALFTDDVYLKNAKNAVETAQALKAVFTKHKIKQFIDSSTNQIFPIIDNDLYKKISKKYLTEVWGKYDEHSQVIRFVCSWYTPMEVIDKFDKDLTEILKK